MFDLLAIFFISLTSIIVAQLVFIRNKKQAFYNTVLFVFLYLLVELLCENTLYIYSRIFIFLLICIVLLIQCEEKKKAFMTIFLIASFNSVFFSIKNSIAIAFGNSTGAINVTYLSIILLVLSLRKYKKIPEWSKNNWSIYIAFIVTTLEIIITCRILSIPPISSIFVSMLMALFLVTSVVMMFAIDEYHYEHMLRLQEKQSHREVIDFMNIVRSQRHDYNFHVQTIAGILQEGNLEASRAYVNQLVQASNAMNTLLPIKDTAISALILNFQQLAQSEGIVLHLNIEHNMENIATTPYETNKIIGNLLQNAIDEVKTHHDKSYGIHMTILKRGEFCVIRISNFIEKDPLTLLDTQNVFKPGYTTKKAHEGVGLSGVKLLVEKYGGTLYNEFDQNIIRFVAKIPLYYKL